MPDGDPPGWTLAGDDGMCGRSCLDNCLRSTDSLESDSRISRTT